MDKLHIELPEQHFDADGRRLARSWPAVTATAGLEVILAKTPIAFVSAAQWRWPEGHAVANRRLPTSNLACYLAGRGRAWIAGEICPISPGTLIITPRGWAQRVEHDPGAPFRALSVHAQLPVFGGHDDLFAVLGAPRRLDLDGRDDAPVFAAMAAMARLDACRPPGWAAAAQAHLTLLVHHLLAAHAGAFAPPRELPAGQDAARLAPALQLIDERLADGGLAIADLARAVGLGPVATRRLFRRLTGLSPKRFIQRRRIDHACTLLRGGDQPIAAIAAAVGCSDAPVFHRLFRSWTGGTPERWRRGLDT